MVFLLGESHEQRSLVGYSPWGHKQSDMTKKLTHPRHPQSSSRLFKSKNMEVHPCAWGLKSLSSFSHSVVSDSLQPHGLQHARPPCLSPTPGACSNSCPLSWWCHPTISSSVVPFSYRLQSFPASGSSPSSDFGVSSLHQVAKVLEFQLQHQSFQWTFRTDSLYNWLVQSPRNPRDS